MTGRQAILIGVQHYKDPLIKDLDFIPDDLAEMSEAFTAAGFETSVHDPEDTDSQSIDSAIEFALQDAAAGATVVIFLTGHGIHHDGMDYLVPSGALTRSYTFAERCVRLNFDRYIERSRAANVIVVVDACREGISIKEKGVANAAAWSRRKVQQVAERQVAYVYACSPGERARYAGDAPNAFSVFTRAFSQVIREKTGSSLLADVVAETQTVLDELTADRELPRQQIRLLSDSAADLPLLTRPPRPTEQDFSLHPWVSMVDSHPAWERVDLGNSAHQQLRAQTIQIVTSLAATCQRNAESLAPDPWFDDQFCARMTARLRWFIGNVLNPDKLGLSTAEAALLVSFPAIYTTFWAANAVAASSVLDGEPVDPAGGPDGKVRFDGFVQSHGRLHRRAQQLAEAGDAEAAAAIRWWLFHRWLIRQPSCYQAEAVRSMIGLDRMPGPDSPASLAAEVFNSERLIALLRAVHMDIAMVVSDDGDAALQQARLIANASENEQTVREVLLSCLLTAAYRFAIDPVLLPEVVADHIGTGYSIETAEVIATIRAATWEARGRTRLLSAECTHAAIDVALHEQVDRLNDLLTTFDMVAERPTLTPLADMPVHAAADRVRAAVGTDGKKRYSSTGMRFHLADDRIQELLMGEQLYGDPALAIRELYQNALDACRYKQARLSYLIAKGDAAVDSELRSWQGRITVRSGEADGRPYIECTDNGVGMGTRELAEVFSHAGVRFSDLPEYVDEQADWRTFDIKLFPNSKFGIGVLSYFMLADDIVVTTSRFRRSGRRDPRLRVHIAGPGSLFKVEEADDSGDSGTTIRLYLRDPRHATPSVALLKRILWLSDHDVEIVDGADTFHLPARQLSPVAAATGSDPDESESATLAKVGEPTVSVATGSPDVFWLSGAGGVLADGLWAGRSKFGYIVNMTGRNLPRLTIDRKAILDYPETVATGMVREQLSHLIDSAPDLFAFDWLCDLLRADPALADAAMQQAVATDCFEWQINGSTGAVRWLGCFLHDEDIFANEVIGNDAYHAEEFTDSLPPDNILQWRFEAWAKAGMFERIRAVDGVQPLTAMPSDIYLLSQGASLEKNYWILASNHRANAQRVRSTPASGFLPLEQVVPRGHIAHVSRSTGRSVTQLVERLTALGFTTPPADSLPEPPTEADIVILGGRDAPLRDHDVTPGHVLQVAKRLGLPVAEVLEKLRQFGFSVADVQIPAEPVTTSLLRILSVDGDARVPWLHTTTPIAAANVWNTVAAGIDVAEAMAVWTRFGFDTSSVGHLVAAGPDERDLLLVSRDHDGRAPWLADTEAIDLVRLVETGEKLAVPLREAAARLRRLGFSVPDVSNISDHLGTDDRSLLTILKSIDPAVDVPRIVLVRAAYTERQPIQEMAQRLRNLGFSISADDAAASYPTNNDIDQLLRGNDSWRQFEQPVHPHAILHLMARHRLTRSEVVTRLRRIGATIDILPEREELDAFQKSMILSVLGAPTRYRALRGDRTTIASIDNVTGFCRNREIPCSRLRDHLHQFDIRTMMPIFPDVVPTVQDAAMLQVLRSFDEPDKPLPLAAIALCAHTSRLSVPETIGRLEDFGYRTPEDAWKAPGRLGGKEIALLSEDLQGIGPWLGREPVTLRHVVSAAGLLDMPLAEVIDTLVAFGLPMPASISSVVTVDPLVR
ncbi:caspase family protein [Actinoplanes sp. N902-109]|uniref:wHTH domain-containing protein n=1 Tax=Actinoplanes sp. (strain N902-109) TaxID=649831 RepID=UPI00032959D8|nr:caspase family protein [Actinoplanes sp. N902-109]AGL19874.1 peptidase C14 caspase catalytic subunit p20 [Actinoplanes sp. N902-109]